MRNQLLARWTIHHVGGCTRKSRHVGLENGKSVQVSKLVCAVVALHTNVGHCTFARGFVHNHNHNHLICLLFCSFFLILVCVPLLESSSVTIKSQLVVNGVRSTRARWPHAAGTAQSNCGTKMAQELGFSSGALLFVACNCQNTRSIPLRNRSCHRTGARTRELARAVVRSTSRRSDAQIHSAARGRASLAASRRSTAGCAG